VRWLSPRRVSFPSVTLPKRRQSALTQFKLQGKDVPHVADLLAAGAGKAQGSVHDMGYALSQSGLVAAISSACRSRTPSAGWPSSPMLASSAPTRARRSRRCCWRCRTRRGRRGSRWTTFGISFYDAQGKFIGLGGVAEVLRRQLGGLTDEQRQQARAQMFGNDAVRAASILYADGAKA
jgi:hypothetical protein